MNPDVVPLLEKGLMQAVGSDKVREIRILELQDHPFFAATLSGLKPAHRQVALILS
jgi:hypothetical protein